ncbi:hypothetical protein QZH41_013666, partial [Actinostola sp. cb2023]
TRLEAAQVCSGTEYRCRNGQCTSMENLCDGKADCDDLTDEKGRCEYRLLYMVGQRLYMLASNSYKPSALLPVPNAGGGMDYDYESMTVYWADNLINVIYKAYLQGLWSDVTIFVHGTGRVDGIAVDWVGRQLYWTDYGKDTIEVSTLSGTHRAILVNTGLDKPREIVLDPARGMRDNISNFRYMYWADWGLVAKIERSHMDGHNREVLVSSTITWPNGLALDLPNNRLYWTDGKRGTIESVSINGTNRRTIFVGKRSHPFSVAVFGDHVFWTDSLANKLERADKRTGQNRRVLQHTGERITNVRVFHPLLRPNSKCNKYTNHPTDVAATASTEVDDKKWPTRATQVHTSHKRKNKILWNKTKVKKSDDIAVNKTEVHRTKAPGKQNTTRDHFCLYEMCKHVGFCEEYLSMRAGRNDIIPVQTNCTCLQWMKGECSRVVFKSRKLMRRPDINTHWIVLLIVFTLLVIAIVLVITTWKKVRTNSTPSPQATYSKKSQRITLTNLPIDDFEFEEEESGRIYNPEPGYENPMFAVSDPCLRTPVYDKPVVFEEPGNECDARGSPPAGNYGQGFQYSPINENLDDENDDERHQFVNPIYVSPNAS